MMSKIFLVVLLALFISITAINHYSSLDLLAAPMTPAEAVRALLPLAAMGSLLVAVAYMYRQLHRAAAAAVGAGTDVAAAVMFASATLLLQLFVCKPIGEGDDDDVARAQPLGGAAAYAIPAAAAATFFPSVALLFLHLRAGGGGAVAGGEGAVQILVKIVLGATAVLVGLMALTI